MKYEIKKLNNTDAVVIGTGREEIKENTNTFKEGFNGDWFWCAKYNKIANNGDITAFDFKIIATIAPFKIEGLPMLELPNQEEDIKLSKLTQQLSYDGISIENINAFKNGYKAAQKQYSKSDMISAFIAGTNSGVEYQSICEDDYEEAEKCAKLDLEDFKQSLQKKQFPSSVELTEDFKPLKWYYE